MSLTAGSRLGPFEILAPLGAGGMGEVYRARDTRLERTVAIKVLPASLSGDPERLRRFEKEARAASALNHPNIVTIYDVGSSGGHSWIAMERVEGKTLRELLSGGPMPFKRVLPIAAQIADGLARAHEVEIVHRDLKPENVMVTRDGLVKILDFGLAKLTASGSGSGETSQLPTEVDTSPGVILGTVGYMSPEQVAGQQLDFRSDQFAFGSILYEMATGKRAFLKRTAVDTLSAILNEEPKPVAEINPQAPAPLRWIVERCLSKEPERRYAATRDLARDLETLRDHSSEAAGIAVLSTPRPGRLGAIWLVAGGLVLLTAGLFAGRPVWKAPPAPTFHQLTFRRGFINPARFAPDGQTVIYSGSFEGKPPQLFSVRPESAESASLALPEAFLSSISRSGELAILLRPYGLQTLARVPIAGGAPRELLENVSEADWAPDGKNLAAVRTIAGKTRIELPIGKVFFETAGWIDNVRVSPAGDRVAFFEHPTVGDDRCSVVVVDAAGKKTTLSEGWVENGGLFWTPDGREIWFSAGRSGVDTEIRAMTLSGKERLVYRAPLLIWLYDMSREGRVLFARASYSTLIRVLAPGETRERDFSWLDNSFVMDFSADGKTLLLGDQGAGGGPNYAVGLRKTDGSPTVRLGEGGAMALSPDGKWALAYLPHPEPAQLILLPTGAGESKALTHDSISHMAVGSWFPDGKRIVFLGSEPGHGARLYVQDLVGGKARPITPEGVEGSSIKISPDGKFAVARSPDGKWSLFPVEGGDPHPIRGLTENDRPLQWGSDGTSLYFRRFGEVPGEVAARIYRLDLSTQRKELWKEILPPEGVQGVGTVHLTPEGKSYAYIYIREISDLYLADGLK